MSENFNFQPPERVGNTDEYILIFLLLLLFAYLCFFLFFFLNRMSCISFFIRLFELLLYLLKFHYANWWLHTPRDIATYKFSFCEINLCKIG